MKYNVSMTEAEFLGLCKMVEGVFGRMIDAASLRGALSVPAEPPLANPAEVPLEVEKPPAAVIHLAPKAAPSEMSEKQKERQISRGHDLFHGLVLQWSLSFGVEGAEQPDRLALLRALATGPDATAVLHFVSSVGGLLHAVDKVMQPKREERDLVRAIAINIAQVSSLFFSDLCAMYEHRDIYRED
jgi:hypothetical protein